MLLNIVTGQKTVAAAGTQLALTTTKKIARGLKLTAPAGNAGAIYIGDANVDSSTGIVVAPGGSIDAGALLEAFKEKDPALDLNTIYVDAATNGDKVTFVYFEPAVA